MKKLTITIFGALLLASFAFADTYKITIPLDIDNTVNGLRIKSSDGVSHLVTGVNVYYKVYCTVNGEVTPLKFGDKMLPFSTEGLHEDVVFEFTTDQGCDTPKYTTNASFRWSGGGSGISSEASKQAVGSSLESVDSSDGGEVTKIN